MAKVPGLEMDDVGRGRPVLRRGDKRHRKVGEINGRRLTDEGRTSAYVLLPALSCWNATGDEARRRAELEGSDRRRRGAATVDRVRAWMSAGSRRARAVRGSRAAGILNEGYVVE